MRKTPKQKRSREMVDRLLKSTAETVAERGLDNTTTNHIADRAGVSIGSLYQYFPDKESLIEGMMSRMGDNIERAYRDKVAEFDINEIPVRGVAKMAITFGFNYIKHDPLANEIIINWNRLPMDIILEPLERYFLVMAQPYFIRNYRDYPVENLEAKLYVLINSTILTSAQYLSQERPHIKEKEFIDTLTDMIVALLEKPAEDDTKG